VSVPGHAWDGGHPHAHGAAVPVVPLEIRNADRGRTRGRGVSARAVRTQAQRADADLDRLAHAVERDRELIHRPAGREEQVIHACPRGLVRLLEAVHQRAALDRHAPADRVDAAVRVAEPRCQVHQQGNPVAGPPLAAEQEVTLGRSHRPFCFVVKAEPGVDAPPRNTDAQPALSPGGGEDGDVHPP
jgi:hypothetical protein